MDCASTAMRIHVAPWRADGGSRLTLMLVMEPPGVSPALSTFAFPFLLPLHVPPLLPTQRAGRSHCDFFSPGALS